MLYTIDCVFGTDWINQTSRNMRNVLIVLMVETLGLIVTFNESNHKILSENIGGCLKNISLNYSQGVRAQLHQILQC